MAAWYLPRGPVGPASRWAATSNVELGQTTFPVNRGRVGQKREGARDKVTKNRRGKQRVKWGKAPRLGIGRDGPKGSTWIFVQRPEFLVSPLLMGSVCL